jgi:hypothetical protein
MTVGTVLESFVERRIFADPETAARALARDYVLNQIKMLTGEIEAFQDKYGMTYGQFCSYLHERSVLLAGDALGPAERRVLSQAVMQEEDDWLEWKATQEMLDSWLGLRQGAET